jgi:(2Fe-2S) ferredoxin
MHYKINNDLIVDDYDQACELIKFGCVEVYEDGVWIDDIDFETAKQGLVKMDLNKLIKE